MESSRIIESDEYKKFIDLRYKQRFNKGVMFMLLAFAVTLAAYFCSRYPIISVCLGVVAEVVLFFMFCFKRILVITDKDYRGTIVSVKKKTVSGGKAIDAGDVPSRFRVKLKIAEDQNGGKTKKHTYYFYNDEADCVKNYFSVGDRVMHHKGLPGPEKEDRSNDKESFCLCCLMLSGIKEKNCPHCGVTLIK